VSRFLAYVRRHHIALLALFVAMGGTSYAAFKLPNNSVGSKQIKANAVNSSKVANDSLLARDFRAGQLPRGPKGDQGIQGLKGDPCPASDPNCKGAKGDTGTQGPGTLSYDGQLPITNSPYVFAISNGLKLSIECDNSQMLVFVGRTDTNHSFFEWGTATSDGTATHPNEFNGTDGQFDYVSSAGTTTAELSLVARSVGPGETPKWTRIDVLGIRASKCNYHALVIPPS
jgi:hypothetical protein